MGGEIWGILIKALISWKGGKWVLYFSALLIIVQVLVKRGMHTLRKEEYQLLYIEKLPQTQEEYVRLSDTSVGVELKELVTD